MRVRLITPPPPIVTWEEADAHLRLDGDLTQRAYVESLIAGATASIDGPSGWLGRALGPQTLEARGEAFWPLGYRLLYPPIIDVLSVKYVDGNGVVQTIDPGAYELDDRELLPVYGTNWPSARNSRSSVQVRYRAGYVADPKAVSLVPAVPENVKRAVLLMVGDLYHHRQTTAAGTVNEVPMSAAVESLLAPLRVFA